MTMYNYSNRVCTVDTYEEEKNESKTIDITIGVFFDGTGNNKYNVYFNQRAKEQFKKGYEAYIDKKVRRNINHLEVMIAIKAGILMLLYCGKCMIRVSHIKKRFI